MKKILTLLFVLFAFAANALATVVWEGNVTFASWSASGDATLPASAFTTAQVGDKLIVTFTDNPADPEGWHQVEIWSDESLAPAMHITGDDTEVTFTIDAKLLAGLQSGNARMAGTGYILSRVELESAPAPTYGVLWSGTLTFVSWSRSFELLIPASDFASVTEGDVIVLTCQQIDAGNIGQIRLEDGATWSAFPNHSDYLALADGNVTELRVTIDADLLAALQADGLRFSGDNLTLTCVSLEEADPTPTPPAPTPAFGTLWTGTLTFVDWNRSIELLIPATDFASAVEGDIIVLTCQKINAEAWGAIRLEGGDWSGALPGQAYIELADGNVTELRVTIDASLLAALQANGLRFSGDNLTLTQVALIPSTYALSLVCPASSVDGGLNGKYVGTFSAPVDVVLPEGVKAYTASVAGDVVTFTILGDGSLVPANTGVLLHAPDAVAPINDVATITDETMPSVGTNALVGTAGATVDVADEVNAYILAYDETEGVQFYRLADAERNVAAGKAYLVVPTGASNLRCVFDGETVTAIDSLTASSAHSAVAVRYDLQGRKISADAKGIIVSAGRKCIR